MGTHQIWCVCVSAARGQSTAEGHPPPPDFLPGCTAPPRSAPDGRPTLRARQGWGRREGESTPFLRLMPVALGRRTSSAAHARPRAGRSAVARVPLPPSPCGGPWGAPPTSCPPPTFPPPPQRRAGVAIECRAKGVASVAVGRSRPVGAALLPPRQGSLGGVVPCQLGPLPARITPLASSRRGVGAISRRGLAALNGG